ncbi:DNL zinc finger-domain-containing protein [Naematelia encephala]|uniref:DNL zinc finger-domain-containing protein n=1 Tax=Naematelia encephala TaxID=71784 RepID=A0A1Y2BLX8_9TREE|nr:DNL zinc finger-domain-containing protein [Naematelia encephala]
MASVRSSLLRATVPVISSVRARPATALSPLITRSTASSSSLSRLTPFLSVRHNSSTTLDPNRASGSSPTSNSVNSEVEAEPGVETFAIEAPSSDSKLNSKSQPIAQLEPRLSLTFTCTHNECNHRSTHEFTKRSYTNGIVIVQCPECKARHLIADHLGWFKESTEEGKLKTIEDLLRAKGEKVRKGRIGMDGDIEIEGE